MSLQLLFIDNTSDDKLHVIDLCVIRLTLRLIKQGACRHIVLQQQQQQSPQCLPLAVLGYCSRKGGHARRRFHITGFLRQSLLKSGYLILKLLLVLSVFSRHIHYCTTDNADKSLEAARDFRKALLQALERLENEHTPDPLLQDVVSIRTKKEEQDSVVAGRKVRDKLLTDETVLVDTFVTTSNVTNVNKERYRSTVTNTVNAQIPVVQSQTFLVAPKPTAATPVTTAALQSEDEEQDETKAKVEDVQFIHAPLVAAFTVQHNAKGLPQKVIPIYGNKRQQQTQVNSVRQYQTTLEEKQRALEQQIRVLQEQRRQQEILLLQQHQLSLQNTAPQKIVPSPVTQASSFQSGTVISLQPSVSYQPSVLLNRQHLVNQQELPVNSAALFRNGGLQSLPRQYRDNVFNPDNYLKDFFYQQRTLVPPPARVNRQEATHLGNFGLNQEYDEHHRHTQHQHSYQFNGNYNSLSPDTTTFIPNQYLQQHNIFTTNNLNTRQPKFNVNDRLKSLIFQSGLGQGREQEDLNIVSKVLALDHSATHYPNFLYSESNVSERRLPFTTFNTT
ncbi:hypothetical protein CBL_05253 [Carabus blaptoides fortunei]